MSNARIELLTRLEQMDAESADAFIVATLCNRTGAVLHATGPFAQAEQALVQAGIEEANWQAACGPDEKDALRFTITPLWEPS